MARKPKTSPGKNDIADGLQAQAKGRSEPPQPAAFVIPTDLLVDVIRVLGALPSQQSAGVFIRLQQLQPLP